MVNYSLLTLPKCLAGLAEREGGLRREEITPASSSWTHMSCGREEGNEKPQSSAAGWRSQLGMERPQCTILWETALREGRGL